MTAPTHYRTFVLDKDHHIMKRHDFEVANDDAALKHARQYVDGHEVEVWQLKRIVATLKH
jgi:hypothetical protein